MSINISIIQSIDNELRNRFIIRSEAYSVFQSFTMFELYKAVKNYKPILFVAENAKKDCIGIMLSVLIKEGSGIMGVLSSRVLIIGGPVISQNIVNRLEVLDALLIKLISTYKHKSIFIQFRNFIEWSEEEKRIFAEHGFIYRKRQNILLKLTDKKTVLKNMSESKRRQVRLAKKNGTIVREPYNIDEVKQFYYILKDLYKNHIRKPLPDISFFIEFYKKTKTDIGVIRLVVVDEKIIGGVIAPITPGKTIYYWYVAGLDRKYRKNYPSVMAVWSLIEYGLNNGIKELDFMGAGNPNKSYGVREFKMRFSKDLIDYGRFGRRNSKLLYSFAEKGYNILRLFKMV